MSINQSFAGRRFESEQLYEVGREKIREFAVAIGTTDPVHTDRAAARELGYPDVVAPPTFPIVLTMGAELKLMADPELGLNFAQVVHREQRFVHHRAILAGDCLRTTVNVDSIRTAAGSDLVTTRTEVTAEDGSPVVTGYSTVVSRGTADEGGDAP